MAGKERRRSKGQVEVPQEESQSIPTPTTQNFSNNPAASSTTRLTPYQRMRQLLAVQNGNAGRVVSAVEGKEDLQAILKNSSEQRDTITIRMKLLWVSDHQHRQLRFARLHFVDAGSPKLLWVSDHQHRQLRFARLHFVDAGSPEPLDESLKVFRDPYQANARTIDAMLFTATVWNVDSEDNGLPPAGAIVDIYSFSNLDLFRDVQCQATVRLTSLTLT